MVIGLELTDDVYSSSFVYFVELNDQRRKRHLLFNHACNGNEKKKNRENFTQLFKKFGKHKKPTIKAARIMD